MILKTIIFIITMSVISFITYYGGIIMVSWWLEHYFSIKTNAIIFFWLLWLYALLLSICSLFLYSYITWAKVKRITHLISLCGAIFFFLWLVYLITDYFVMMEYSLNGIFSERVMDILIPFLLIIVYHIPFWSLYIILLNQFFSKLSAR